MVLTTRSGIWIVEVKAYNPNTVVDFGLFKNGCCCSLCSLYPDEEEYTFTVNQYDKVCHRICGNCKLGIYLRDNGVGLDNDDDFDEIGSEAIGIDFNDCSSIFNETYRLTSRWGNNNIRIQICEEYGLREMATDLNTIRKLHSFEENCVMM